jgi:hypothetical protein
MGKTGMSSIAAAEVERAGGRPTTGDSVTGFGVMIQY